MTATMKVLRSVLVAAPLAVAAPQRYPAASAYVVDDAASSSLNVPQGEHTRIAEGFATFYGEALEGTTTASGVPYNPDAFVAAHQAHGHITELRQPVHPAAARKPLKHRLPFHSPHTTRIRLLRRGCA